MTFEYYYLFGAVEPTTGDDFLLELPALNTETFQVFMDAFSQQYPSTTNIMIMDRGAFHMARDLVIPGNVTFIFLPPYSPQLNPIERYWKHLKDHVARLICETTPERVRSLTQFPFFMDAING